MKKILSTITLFFFFFSELLAWKAQPPGALPPEPIILLNAGEHLLCGKGRDGKVELEDGTQFKVLPTEALHIYEEWKYHDHISVTCNTNFFGGSEYYLRNITKEDDLGEAMHHANLIAEPYEGSPYTQFINHIDPYDGEISVFNGNGNEFCWEIERKDMSSLEGWEKGDCILIGMNDLWIETWFSSCKFVMINVSKPYLSSLRISPIANND